MSFSLTFPVKKEWDVDKNRWRALGFHSGMSLEDARVRAKQINAQRFLKEQEKRLYTQQKIEKAEKIKNEFCLPLEFVAEFEKRFIRVRDSETESGRRKKSRAHIVWRAAQKTIVAVQIEPSEWFYHIHEIYDHFHGCRYSVRYIHAILKFINLWGFFISRKLAQPFLQIPVPRGYERMRLIEANYQKQSDSVRRVSKPLTPEQLDLVIERLNRENFNWLFLSVWFGLRPQEIDNLKNKNLWKIKKLQNGREILWIFQTKIVALPPEDRWKPIPIIFEQQKFGLQIIKSGFYKRPIIKTMRRHFGRGIDLYGGRKGFSDLMLKKNQSFENISVWMGHSTLDRTWRSYKCRTQFHLKNY